MTAVEQFRVSTQEISKLAELVFLALSNKKVATFYKLANTPYFKTFQIVRIEKLEEITQHVDLDALANEFNVQVHGFTDPFGQLSKWIADAFQSWMNWLWNNIKMYIVEPFTQFFNTIIGWLSDIVNVAGRYLQNLISVFNKYIVKPITSFFTEVSNLILQGINTVSQAVANLGQQIYKFFTETVPQFFSNLGQQIWNWLNQLWSWIQGGLQWLYNALSGIINEVHLIVKQILNKLVMGLYSLGQQIWSGVNYVVRQLSSFFSNVAQTILNVVSSIGKTVQNVWQAIVQFFTKTFPAFVNNVVSALAQLGNYISGFVNAILQLPNLLAMAIRPIVEAVISRLQWLGETLWNAVKNGLARLGSVIANGLRWLGETLFNILKTIGTALFNAIIAGLQTIYSSLRQGIHLLVDFFAKLFAEPTFDIILPIADLLLLPTHVFEKIKSAFTKLKDVVLRYLGRILTLFGIAGAGKTIVELTPDPEIDLSPFGLGFKLKLKLSKLLKSAVDFFRDLGRHLAFAWAIELALTEADPVTKAIKYYTNETFRNVIPIEIPTIHEGKELVQRSFATKKFEEILSWYRKWLAMRGFADNIIDLFARKPNEWYITVKDRFGKERIVPLAYIYEIPTVSELCRMMIKDMFASIEDFTKIMRARGVYDDIAKLFYFLHFRYPSPEKLWEFVCRCIAGETWFVPTQEMIEEANKEAQKLGAFTPETPFKLGNAIKNSELAKRIFIAFSTYMKWHDYAKFAWIDKFTSDNWLIIDVLPDIPTKIDLRWMSRWGIFEAWSAYGVSTIDRIDEILTKVLNRDPSVVYRHLYEQLTKTTIEMDIRQYCRLLQADKLHPLWVPIVAVAETINALTEERTLLRTGFWNLYKEGLFDIEAMNKMFAGFFTVKFKVAYFDIMSYSWKDAEFNIPVMFLPAEAKLIEIRAIMDRAVDLWRDLMREVMYGIRHAIWTPEEALAILKYFVSKQVDPQYKAVIPVQLEESLSEWFKNAIKSITGKEVELPIDVDWVKLYTYVFKTAYEVEKIQRLRYWLVRIIAWAIYRLAYGYVTKADIENLVSIVQQKAKLTSYEADAIKEIAELLTGIAKREYIPTPYMMATIVEIVPEARKLVDEVLQKRGVPREWWSIWKKYIELRPLYNELYRLRTRVETAFSYGALSIHSLNSFLNELKKYGWTDTEITIERLIAFVYRAQRIFAQIIPTPIGLTYYYRYVDTALNLLELKLKAILETEVLQQILKINNVGQFVRQLIEFYKKLAINRAVYPDLRGYIYELIRAYEYGVIDDAKLQEELNTLKQYGLKDDNIKLIVKRAKLRRAIRQTRQRF